MYFFLVRIAGGVARLLYPVHFTGLENIPAQGGLILCCNHQSVLDPLLLMMKFPRKIHFMAKNELFTDHGRLAGWFLRMMGAFPVHRNSADTQSIKNALAVLSRGSVLGIFPQGGCVYGSTLFKARAGVGFITVKSHCDVLPACIYCKGRMRPFKRIFVNFGEVIPYSSLLLKQSVKETRALATDRIEQSICTLLERADSALQR